MKKSGWCLRRPIGTPSESAHTLAHTLVWEEYVIVSDKERHLSHNKREKNEKKRKSESIGLNGPILYIYIYILNELVSLFYIYNFYFENLIYK